MGSTPTAALLKQKHLKSNILKSSDKLQKELG